MTESQAHYLLIFSGITAVAILLGAIAFVIMATTFARLMRHFSVLAKETQGKIYPILENVQDISDKMADITHTAREFTADAAPRLRRATRNIEETSDVYRAKVAEIDSLITDTTDKARRQTERVDAFVTNTMDRTHDVVSTTINRAQQLLDSMQHAVYAPVRQISGLVNGVKAGIDALIANFTPKPTSRPPKPVAFEGESVYTGYEDDYHA